MLRTTTGIMGIALLLAACGNDGGSHGDAGRTSDSGMTDAGPMGSDAGPTGRDSGTSSDPCASDVMERPDRVGCNGWASGDPMPNGPLGTCTPAADPMMMPQGSCTTPNAVCAAGEGAEMGICVVRCPRAATYISTGGCPMGFRCFTLGDELAVCFRDCDAMHPCPTGYECDAEGSCVRPR